MQAAPSEFELCSKRLASSTRIKIVDTGQNSFAGSLVVPHDAKNVYSEGEVFEESRRYCLKLGMSSVPNETKRSVLDLKLKAMHTVFSCSLRMADLEVLGIRLRGFVIAVPLS